MIILRVWIASLLFCAAIVVSGCASTVIRSAQTSTDYQKVFEAARQAAIERAFGVTSADINTGFISGRQGVLAGSGNQVLLNIQVSKGTPTKVEVSVVPPPGVIGDTDGIVRGIFAAMKNRIPDLAVPN